MDIKVISSQYTFAALRQEANVQKKAIRAQIDKGKVVFGVPYLVVFNSSSRLVTPYNVHLPEGPRQEIYTTVL